MSLLQRLRRGLVGAALRFGVEEGITQVTRTRASQATPDVSVSGGEVVNDADVAGTVALPVGETALEDLQADADMKELFGVSMEEMRYMAGIANPFEEPTLDTRALDLGDLSDFRSVRATTLTEADRRAIVAALPQGDDAVEAPNNRYRAFGLAGHAQHFDE